MGRLLYDLKLVPQRSYDKLARDSSAIGKSSFAFAWVMDSTAEERARGITVDIATNAFETEQTHFTILDAPGHRDFIPNMIAGASQADFAVLVIDASANAFESGLRGQTKEHALLVRSMGIARLIVAINKMDTAGWSQDRYNEVSQQMSAFLLAAGFKEEQLAFVPCAGLTGENVANPPLADTMPWYKGTTLVGELDKSEPTARLLTAPLRMTISDVFRGGVTNPVSISGRLDAGHLQIGDVILAMPAGQTATVRAIEVDQGEMADYCVAGQIATLHLADIDPVHLRPGDIISSPTNDPVKNITAFTAKILAFEHVTPGWVDVHRGRLHTPAKVAELLASLGKASGEVEKKKPRIVKPGGVARVRVVLEKALPLDKGARVVLRSEGATVAAGLIEAIEI
jgi:elongation factor 1 alpha-like protein